MAAYSLHLLLSIESLRPIEAASARPRMTRVPPPGSGLAFADPPIPTPIPISSPLACGARGIVNCWVPLPIGPAGLGKNAEKAVNGGPKACDTTTPPPISADSLAPAVVLTLQLKDRLKTRE